jgi:hypothetical protein
MHQTGGDSDRDDGSVYAHEDLPRCAQPECRSHFKSLQRQLGTRDEELRLAAGTPFSLIRAHSTEIGQAVLGKYDTALFDIQTLNSLVIYSKIKCLIVRFAISRRKRRKCSDRFKKS